MEATHCGDGGGLAGLAIRWPRGQYVVDARCARVIAVSDQPKPKKNVTPGQVIFALIALVVIFFWITSRHEKNSAPRTPPGPVKYDAVTWREIDAIYSLRSKSTELQKKGAWEKYKGKRVKWTGYVAEVGETFGSLSLQVKMNGSTITSDVIVSLRDNERPTAVKLAQGNKVTFGGVLEDWGTVLPISLSDGEIIEFWTN